MLTYGYIDHMDSAFLNELSHIGTHTYLGAGYVHTWRQTVEPGMQFYYIEIHIIKIPYFGAKYVHTWLLSMAPLKSELELM